MPAKRCNVWPTRLPQLLSRRGESASSQLAIRRVRSLPRTTPLRKLLARKRVPRTNGRRIRLVCRAGEQATRRDNSFLDYTERKRERHFSLTFSTTHTLEHHERNKRKSSKNRTLSTRKTKKNRYFREALSLPRERRLFCLLGRRVLRVLSSLVAFIFSR